MADKRPKEMRKGDVLIGEHGGRSRITGMIEDSADDPFAVVVETEHGPLHLGEDERYTVEEAGPRYVGRGRQQTPTTTVYEIYDTVTESWPVFQGGRRIPQQFDSIDAAQAWADTYLNGK